MWERGAPVSADFGHFGFKYYKLNTEGKETNEKAS